VAFFNGKMEELLSYRENVTPAQVIEEFRLREPRYAEMCKEGLFK
jgi:S-adenosylmethionine synthetase